jgi:CubicO group peptidase (beta-lactamase class C family)
MLNRKLSLLALLSIIAISPLTAQRMVNPLVALEEVNTIKPKIAKLMNTAGIPGLSVVVIEDNKITYKDHFGVKSLDTGEPIDDHTIFCAADMGKPVFTYAVLQLVEEGIIDLDMPLYAYLENPALARDERYKLITARLVLNHTSGLPNWGYQGLSISFSPGQQFQYSGEGYKYLMKVVEELTKQPINEVLKERVFMPLDMTNSSFVWEERFEPHTAFPHNKISRAIQKHRPYEANVSLSMQTTATDYAKFLLACMNDQGLKPESLDEMLTPQVSIKELPESNSQIDWGLGFGLQETDEGKAFWHWGDYNLSTGYAVAYKEQKKAVVYFTNSENGLIIGDQIIDVCVGGSHPTFSSLINEASELAIRYLIREMSVNNKSFKEAVQPYMAENGHHQDKELLDESRMISLGYELFYNGQLEKAKEVFAMNLLAFPESAIAYDCYANVCMHGGDQESALQHFEKAVELDSTRDITREIIKQLTRQTKGNTEFRLPYHTNARHVSVSGSFNNWDPFNLPCVRENGEWVCTIDLEPGSYQYKFIVDGVWILDPTNDESVYVDHYHNSVVKVK